MNSFVVKIGGEAGFGIMTSGLVLAKIAIRNGYHIFDYTEYPSLIRGGHNTYEIRIADEEVHAHSQSVDLLICLNKDTYMFHSHRLHEGSVVIYDPEDLPQFTGPGIGIAVPFKQLKKDMSVFQVMINTIAMGAAIAVLDARLETFFDLITEEFQRKGDDVVAFNKKLAQVGYDHVRHHYPSVSGPKMPTREDYEKLVMTANDAFSIASAAADCRLYAAYPMTPSSTVLASLAAWQKKTGMIVRHSEDEIAVVSTALGASFAGVRSAVGTSGGGFALMVESLSYAGIAEIPLVVYLGQRPGPATGMPTWTEQGDLLFAVHAGHGEFPKIVLTPGDIDEMIALTLQAYDLADTYQLPVIVMSDKLIGESHKSISAKETRTLLERYVPNRGKDIESYDGSYARYQVTDDGISPRLIPGTKGHFYQANSYEHEEDSHTTERADHRIAQVDKRNRKWQTYLHTHFETPRVFGSPDAEIGFVSWGGNKGAILEAQRVLRSEGIETAFYHFTHVYPLDEIKVREALPDSKRLILIENNSHGQFGKLLQMECGIRIQEKLLKYDGRPIYWEDIVNYIRSHR